MIKLIIITLAAYIAGSVNMAILVFKLTGKGDPRTQFSGNAGTTNIYRQAGLLWAAAVFVLDFGRAIAVSAVSLCMLDPQFVPLSGFALILGNTFPCFHGFKGGKGVANYLGFTAVISPVLAAASAGLWLIVYLLIKIPFTASFSMIFLLAFANIKINNYHAFSTIITLLTVLLIVFNHKKNLIELRNKRLSHDK